MSQCLRPCFCTSFQCNGKKIRPADSGRHARLDEEKRRRIAKSGHPISNDTLVQQVFRMTLNTSTSTPESNEGEAIWERDLRNPAQGVFVVSLDDPPASAESVPGGHPPPKLASAPTVSENPHHTRALYDLVLAMDHNIEEHVNVVTAALLKPTTLDNFLKEEEQWFRDSIHNVHAVNPSGDAATRVLREAMIDRLVNQLSL